MPRVHHERVTISGQTSAGAAKDCLVDADGRLQIDIIDGGGGGDASAANQATGNSTLATISGKITACNTGAVVVTSAPTTAVTNAVLATAIKAEDTVHAAGDAGVMSLAVRGDALAALAGTTGDYSALQVNENGALYIAHDSPRVSTIMSSQSVSSGTGGLLSSALKVIGRPKAISFEVSNGSLTGTNFEVKLQVCDTLSGTYRWLGSSLYQYSTGYDNAVNSLEQKEKFITVKDLIWPYFKVWVKQESGGAVNFTVKACQ